MNLSAIISVLAAEQSSPASLAMTFIPLVLIIVFFYFFIIRPQKKQDKKDAEMRDNLEIGDEVVTNGGIVGIVFSIKDDTVVSKQAETEARFVLRSGLSLRTKQFMTVTQSKYRF